jgi:hypothetical protein
MSILKRALSSVAFLCLALTSGFAATEILYVTHGRSIDTYSVNKTTAEATKLNTLKTNYLPFSMQRFGSFLYVCAEFETDNPTTAILVYRVTAEGVPEVKPVQTLSVKNQLAQLTIHPDGTIAYVMFWWQQNVKGTLESASDIVLFTRDSKTGRLTNTTKVLAKFPLRASCCAPDDFTLTPKGTKIFAVTNIHESSSVLTVTYAYFTVNPKSGVLVKADWSWQDVITETQSPYSTFGDALIVQMDGLGHGIRVYPMGAKQDSTPIIDCTSKMLAVCGDRGQFPQLDPSGGYLTFDDFSVEEIPFVTINTTAKRLQETESTPGNSNGTVVFSPDEALVYYLAEFTQDLPLQVDAHAFHSGKFTGRNTITIPDGIGGILPAQ